MVYLAFFQPLVFSYCVQTDEELLILFSYLNFKVIHVQLFHETLHLHLQVNQH